MRAEQPRRERREHQEIRHGMNPDEIVALAQMQPQQTKRSQYEERQILKQVDEETASVMALHGRAIHPIMVCVWSPGEKCRNHSSPVRV
jgi:hypothetical protein